MGERDDDALDPWLDELLAADRAVPSIAPAHADRLLARLETSVAALGDPGPDPGAGGGGDAGAGGAATAAGAAGLGKLAVATIAGVIGLATGGVTGWFARGAAPGPAPAAPVVTLAIDAGAAPVLDAPDPAPPVDAGATDAREPAPLDARAPTHAPPPRAERLDAGPRAAPEAGGSDADLAAENALITRAQSALGRGQAAEALAAAEEHGRRFAGGRLAEEREVLAILALARLGRTDAARARADRFFARYPDSLSTRVVRGAVAP